MGRCPLAAVHVLAAPGKRPVGRGTGRMTGPVQRLRKERKEQEQRRGEGAAVPGAELGRSSQQAGAKERQWFHRRVYALRGGVQYKAGG